MRLDIEINDDSRFTRIFSPEINALVVSRIVLWELLAVLGGYRKCELVGEVEEVGADVR